MISYYSTLIQFVAAIYVTLSFDNILFKNLWSMDYAELINDRITGFFPPASSVTENNLKQNILRNALSIERISRARGFYCLFFSIVTMWYLGYEQSVFKTEQSSIGTLHIHYAIYVILSILGYVISWVWIERLLHTFFICLAISVMSIIIGFFDLSCLLDIGIFIFIGNHIPEICSIIVLIPLILQLMMSWLFSDNYYYLLGSNIKKEFDDYNKALYAHHIDEVPDVYKAAIGKSYYELKNDGSKDTSITNITNVMKQRLDKAVKIPSTFVLLKYAAHNIFKTKIDELVSINKPNIKGEEIAPEEKEIKPQTKIRAQNLSQLKKMKK